jgi:predicted NBD/HSP70 family sugar kinase
MQGWDGIDFIEVFGKELATPIYLENDANLIAFAEWKLVYPDERDLLVVKLGTGIGSGIILNKQLHRGAQGAAGDLGHVQLDALKGSACRCGHTDCVESFSGGWALVEKLNEMGYKVKNTTDIAELCRKGDAKVIRLLTEASSYIGHAIADAVNLLNPSKVVIEGRLVNATDLVLATVKEVVYQRAGALATKHLSVVPAKLGTDCAVLGAAQLGVDRFFYGISDS